MSRLTRWLHALQRRNFKSRLGNGEGVQPPTPQKLNSVQSKSENIQVGRHLLDPPIKVEIDVSTAARKTLFEHLSNVWKRMGETEPYESVLYSPAFRMNRIDDHRAEFYMTADYDMHLIRSFFNRNNKSFGAVKSVLEIGCGVGRVTARLAGKVERVVAVDISPNHLALAREHVGRLGYQNVEFARVTSPDDFKTLPSCDLFFSSIVLQHNPPPLIAWILSALLANLKPGGYCLFQVPTYTKGYEFTFSRYLDLAAGAIPDGYEYNASRYIDTPTASIDMHVLPQKEIYAILRENKIELLEVAEDRATGSQFQSMVFFGQKTAAKVRSRPVATRPESQLEGTAE